MAPRVRWQEFGLGLGVLGLLGGVVVLLVVLVGSDVGRADNVASILGFVVTALSAIAGLIIWRDRAQPARKSLVTAEQLNEAMEWLASMVGEQWRREAEARSLANPEPMPVRWRLSSTRLMDHSRLIAGGRLVFTGRGDRIEKLVEQFRSLRRRRLVIIGGPGAGKTTLAVQLLLELNRTRQRGDPVPVLLSLASWSPDLQPRLQDWLADRLSHGYPGIRAFGAMTASTLVERGHILLVLDGLDEVPDARRAVVVTALNGSFADDTGLILTSRATEYQDTVADVRITGAAVIEPEPLTGGQSADYLATVLPPRPSQAWQRLLAVLRSGDAGNLAATTATPLGLWLLRAVYVETRTDPTQLLNLSRFPTPAAIHVHLLDALIPATVSSRPPTGPDAQPFRPRRRYRPDQVRRWLVELARQLDSSGSRDWLWWRFPDLVMTPWRFKLVVGIFSGVTSGALAGFTGTITHQWKFGLIFAIATGTAVGGSIVIVGSLHNNPAHLDLRIGGRVGPLVVRLAGGVLAGSLVGVIGGLGVGLIADIAGVPGGLTRGLVYGLSGGLAAGFAEGLVAWARTPGKALLASSPTASHHGDRALTLLVAVMFGLLVGCGVGLAVSARSSPAIGLAVGVAVGLATGVVGAFTGGLTSALTRGRTNGRGGNTAWPAFATATIWLAARGRLPLSLMRFLDDAHRLGLLRMVGPVYQFRHADLQDHLAKGCSATGF